MKKTSPPSGLGVLPGFVSSHVPQAVEGPFVCRYETVDTIGEALDFAVQMNVAVVDLLLSSARGIDVDALNEQYRVRGLQVGAVGTGGMAAELELFLTHPEADHRRRTAEVAIELVELGARLGEGVPVIVGSIQGMRFTTSTKTTPDGREWPRIEEAHEFLGEGLKKIASRANDLGVPLIFEVLNDGESNLFPSLEMADRFVQSLDCGAIEFLLDSYHWLCEGWTVEAVKSLKTKIGYAHIVGHNRAPAEVGSPESERLAQFAEALKAADYRGALVAECNPDPDRAAAVEKTMAWVRHHFGE